MSKFHVGDRVRVVDADNAALEFWDDRSRKAWCGRPGIIVRIEYQDNVVVMDDNKEIGYFMDESIELFRNFETSNKFHF